MSPIQKDETQTKATPKSPTMAMAKLELRSQTKRAKLASSKSLTQLIPRSLFFLRKTSTGQTKEEPSPGQENELIQPNGTLLTCRSFPSQSLKTNFDIPTGKDHTQPSDHDDNLDSDSTPDNDDRMHRLVAWPGLSDPHNPISSNLFGPLNTNKETVDVRRVQKKELQTSEGRENGLRNMFNPSFLFARGNKFVEPRCRGQQPFARLTNELATPSPTKLYSPFGIETPDTDMAKATRQAKKSKRKLDLGTSNRNCVKRLNTPDRTNMRPITADGSRVAQVKLANKKFTNFVSPTGKFRETVDYVRQSQRDIEAISEAIMARSAATRHKKPADY